MIHVKVEMWPQGDPARAYPLGEAIVINDGTGTAGKGNYDVCLSKRGGFAKGQWKSGRVENFPRQRLGVWDLLFRSLAVLQSRSKGSSVDEAAQVGSEEESPALGTEGDTDATLPESVKRATAPLTDLGFGAEMSEMFQVCLEQLFKDHPRLCPGASKSPPKAP